MAAAGTQNERLGDGPSVRRKDKAGDCRAVMEARRDRETYMHAPCRAWLGVMRVLDGSAPKRAVQGPRIVHLRRVDRAA